MLQEQLNELIGDLDRELGIESNTGVNDKDESGSNSRLLYHL